MTSLRTLLKDESDGDPKGEFSSKWKIKKIGVGNITTAFEMLPVAW